MITCLEREEKTKTKKNNKKKKTEKKEENEYRKEIRASNIIRIY